jgi:hypothetical protein
MGANDGRPLQVRALVRLSPSHFFAEFFHNGLPQKQHNGHKTECVVPIRVCHACVCLSFSCILSVYFPICIRCSLLMDNVDRCCVICFFVAQSWWITSLSEYWSSRISESPSSRCGTLQHVFLLVCSSVSWVTVTRCVGIHKISLSMGGCAGQVEKPQVNNLRERDHYQVNGGGDRV